MKKYIGLGVILGLAIALVWWQFPRKTEAPVTTDTNQTSAPQESEPNTSILQARPGIEASPSNTFVGVLKASDNAKRGNLMLVMENKSLYIFTNRDYSGLIGKTVLVSYDGTEEDFRLADIQEK